MNQVKKSLIRFYELNKPEVFILPWHKPPPKGFHVTPWFMWQYVYVFNTLFEAKLFLSLEISWMFSLIVFKKHYWCGLKHVCWIKKFDFQPPKAGFPLVRTRWVVHLPQHHRQNNHWALPEGVEPACPRPICSPPLLRNEQYVFIA